MVCLFVSIGSQGMLADKAGHGPAGGAFRTSRSTGRVAGWGAAAAACIALLVVACSKAPAEQRLRERIAAMEAAVEARDAGGFMDGVAPNFIGESGTDQRALRALLAAQMMRNAQIGAVLGPLDIAIDGVQARVSFQLVLTGGAGGLLPERARAWRVDSGWRDGDDGWQVVTAEWRPVGG